MKKKRSLIVLLASVLLVLVMVITGCSVNTPSTTQANSKTTSAKEMEKIYNCLNPLGIQPPVTISPLAARLDTLDGKTIYIIQGEADPVIFPALYTALQKAYPKTDWVYYLPSSSFGPSTPDDTTKAAAKATLRGVAW